MKLTGTSPGAALVTLGCPMNQVDSERIMSGLLSLGFEIVPEEKAEIIVVNTCGFISEAVEESLETIMSIADLKRSGNLRSLVVSGCLVERYRNKLETELTEADALVGLDARESIPALCLKLLDREKPLETVHSRVVTGPIHSAYLKISEGCSNCCSYCTIPMIRGPLRSIPEKELLNEAADLAFIGIRELILIGQDTANYGSDLDGLRLNGLLQRIAEIDDIDWIRLMYLHPAHLTDDIIDAIDGIPKALSYVDMPVQHISQGILKRMGRMTTPDYLYGIIEKLRKRIEGLILRTTLIVGYPGETDRNFRELVEFVEQERFERLGVFIYSHEEGTRAAADKPQVPVEIAQERYQTIMEVQAGIAEEFHNSLVGSELDMIVDTIDPETGTTFGRSYMDAPEIDGNISVSESVEEDKAFYRVQVTGAGTYDLIGKVVNETVPLIL